MSETRRTPRTIIEPLPVQHQCSHLSEFDRLRKAVDERAQVDVKLDARLSGIESKLNSLTWRLAIIAGAVQAAAQFFEYVKR